MNISQCVDKYEWDVKPNKLNKVTIKNFKPFPEQLALMAAIHTIPATAGLAQALCVYLTH